MKFLENLKNIIEKANKLDGSTLEALRYTLMGIIVIDLFGIYWFLELKKLGVALLMVVIFAMLIVIILEGRLPPPKKKHIQKVQKEVKNKMNEQELMPKKPESEGEVVEDEKDEKDKEEPEAEEEASQPGDILSGSDNLGVGLPNAEEYQKRVENAIL